MMRAVAWFVAVVVLAGRASEPKAAHEEPTEWGTARHMLFGFALGNGVPRDNAACVVEEVMRTLDPAEIDRLEAVARGDQKLTENEMGAFNQIVAVGARNGQPTIAAACDL